MQVRIHYHANIKTVNIPSAIFFGWQLEDTHVCDGKPVRGSSERDSDKLEVRNESKTITHRFLLHMLTSSQGPQHPYWHSEEVEKERVVDVFG